MAATGRSYVIAGAGISGLTLALGLAHRGATVTVLERSEALQTFGAGIQISPNARHVLDGLGLRDAISRVSFEPKALDVYGQGGQQPIISLQLGTLMRERFGAPYAVMHRADLATVLHDACAAQPGIDIVFGVRDWEVAEDPGGVTTTADAAEGQSRVYRGNAFIGADGVHSRTRRELLGGPAARFGRRIAWRALVPTSSVAGQIATDRVSIFLGQGFHLVCYPLPHRGQTNLALFLPSSTPDPGRLPSLRRPGPRVGAILAAGGERWTPWPLHTVSTDVWHRGAIGIIGDAAHAMVPFQAQGAAMGIEDAAALVPLLMGTDSPVHAFASYAARRQARVRRVSQLSAQNGRIFHLGWPLSGGRDLVMRLQGPRAHLRRLGWIYAHRIDASRPD